ncbi:divergent polysaccharide deacetylase family protein [Thermoproteota archaeon]
MKEEKRVEKRESVSYVKKVVPKKVVPVPVVKAKKSKAKLRKSISKTRRAKIAIVLDDWGYNTRNLDMLSEIDQPLTIAILPFRPFSRRVAEFANKNNCEVIIHMPMEPIDIESVDLEPKTLMLYMGSGTVQSILRDAFQNIPYAKGINNHMGSRATGDSEYMSHVFKELKIKNLYFLDSLVVADSVCAAAAKEVGVKFAKRSIFLDNSSDDLYIRAQVMELVDSADDNGYAIGIGHDRESTLKVLKELIPELEEQGYEFVFVSDLVK